MTIVHRTQFSATAVLCGASIFAYPAIAWGACAPATVDTGAPIVATDQLLEQVRQRREQQATVSMFSAAGSSAARSPLQNPARVRQPPRRTNVSLFSAPVAQRHGYGAARDRASQSTPFLTRSRKTAKAGAANGMSKRRPPRARPVRLPQNSIFLRAIRIADTL